MGQTTIGWTATYVPPTDKFPAGRWMPGYTYNIAWGCTKVSKGCDNCYAEKDSKRYGFPAIWGPEGTTAVNGMPVTRRVFGAKHWAEPLAWNNRAQKLGVRLKVFCSSMSDVFEKHSIIAREREKLWPLIEATPDLDWLLLTKRPGNIMKSVPAHWQQQFPTNVWVGTSVEMQKYAQRRLEELIPIPAIVHFVSIEPQLEHVDVRPWLDRLQWIICGGESGPKHRPFQLDWARSLREQCQEYHVPFFFKQVGGQTHASGGRVLDDRTWDEFPFQLQEVS